MLVPRRGALRGGRQVPAGPPGPSGGVPRALGAGARTSLRREPPLSGVPAGRRGVALSSGSWWDVMPTPRRLLGSTPPRPVRCLQQSRESRFLWWLPLPSRVITQAIFCLRGCGGRGGGPLGQPLGRGGFGGEGGGGVDPGASGMGSGARRATDIGQHCHPPSSDWWGPTLALASLAEGQRPSRLPGAGPLPFSASSSVCP